MLGFTLSKLNLLILVTATFAMVAFFMIGITDFVISISAQQTLDTYAEKAANVITSESLCFRTEVTIPKHISYFGGVSAASRFFYLMFIARLPADYDPEYLTSVVFAISDSTDPTKLRAASRIDVNAEVIFYDWNPSEMNIIDDSVSSIKLDPQSALMPKDSFIIIKEVLEGHTFLHIIACSSGGTCPSNVQDVACNKIKSVRGKESACLPCPE